jgi:hypothetical protein
MKRALAAVAIVVAVAGCGKRSDYGCSRVPDIAVFSMVSGELGEEKARARAADCLHYEAYRLAPGEGDNEAVALGAMGACLAQIQSAQASAYLSGSTASPPPPGFLMDRIDPESLPIGDEAGSVTKTRETLSQRVWDDMRLIALFRVAEARVLRCK